MKKFCYLLSIAGHALVLLIVLNTRFAITIRPEPPRVIAVEIEAPPPAFFASGPPPAAAGPGRARGTAPGGAGGRSAAAPGGRTAAGGVPALPFALPRTFSLKEAPEAMFRLAPASKTPELALRPVGPSSSLERYSAAAYRPGVSMAGADGQGGAVLIPFDIKERAIAAWTEAVLARIERNWIIPPMGRLAFAGQVRIDLTIEKNGGSLALAVADSSLPEAMSQAALQAVKASLPLPRLPENVAGREFAFTFVFIYNG